MKKFMYASVIFIGLGSLPTYTIDMESVKDTMASAKAKVAHAIKSTYQKNKAVCHIGAGLGLFCVALATLPAYGALLAQGKEMNTRASVITAAQKIVVGSIVATITSLSAYFGYKHLSKGRTELQK